jgi:hypothetical protein
MELDDMYCAPWTPVSLPSRDKAFEARGVWAGALW